MNLNPLLVCESRIHESVVIYTELLEKHNSIRVVSYLFHYVDVIARPNELSKAPHTTQDGVTVVKEVQLTNSFKNIGCCLLYHIPNNCIDTASDCIAATVIARRLNKEGIKSIGFGINPLDIKIGINICGKCLLNILTKPFRQELMDVDVIEYIARNASNHDEQLQH